LLAFQTPKYLEDEFANLNVIAEDDTNLSEAQRIVINTYPRAFVNYIHKNKTWIIYVPNEVNKRVALVKGLATEQQAWSNAAKLIQDGKKD